MVHMYGIHSGSPDWGVDDPHPPGFVRLYFHTRGEGFYGEKKIRFAFAPETLYLLPSSRNYRLSQTPSRPFSCTYVHYDIFPRNLAEPAVIPLASHPLLERLTQALTLAAEERNGPLFSLIADSLLAYCDGRNLINYTSGVLTPVLQYIDDNLGGDLSLERLSTMAGYNSQYFIRLFKKETGLTPHQYVISHRIKEAKKCLISGRSVTRTAEQAGYSDVKVFSRSFKGYTGVAPRDYGERSRLNP